MVFCSSCGNEETSEKNFCSKCGLQHWMVLQNKSGYVHQYFPGIELPLIQPFVLLTKCQYPEIENVNYMFTLDNVTIFPLVKVSNVNPIVDKDNNEINFLLDKRNKLINAVVKSGSDGTTGMVYKNALPMPNIVNPYYFSLYWIVECYGRENAT